MRSTKKKKKVLTEEQIRKRNDAKFQRKITSVFVMAGFQFLKTANKEVKIGHRVVEIDSVYLYENILLICEDTGGTNKIKDHIRKKQEAFAEITNNFSFFLKWLCDTFPEKEESLKKYEEDRYQKFFLYFSQNELNFNEEEKKRFSDIIFVEPLTLDYFHRMGQCIKLSSRYDIFRFLNIKKDQIGPISSEGSKKIIKAPIIYPKSYTGLKNDVRVISFMMSAESLLSTCYVMRKDNWEDSTMLYQRLIDKNKIKNIRGFLASKKAAFYNNIIVGLPDDIRFEDISQKSKSITELTVLEDCKLEFPDEINSVCVIDGQHRIYAHYEGNDTDKYEKEISGLRGQLHLLVTGLIFPPEMKEIERIRIQSEIFLDINSNAKPVNADGLLHIEKVINPFCDKSIALRVIEGLNKTELFRGMFGLNSLATAKVKIASIVKFALRYLVTLNPTKERESFYTYWKGDKVAVENADTVAFKSYIDYCVKNLELYFSAVKNNFEKEWYDPSSKILSVISLNGFIIAYNRQLKKNGVSSFDFFDTSLKKLSINFSDKFPYTSSQYRKFSDQIIKDAFNISDN